MKTLKKVLQKYRHRSLIALQRLIKMKLNITISDEAMKKRMERLDEG